MRFDDIHFYINDRRVGPTGIIGAQPDLDLFDQLKQHLLGRCTVKFRVGDQEVENHVSLNGVNLRVENNFQATDIAATIESEKKRVRREQEEASFKDELTEVFFIPADALLSCGSAFPAFDRRHLVMDAEGLRFFVSHPWLTRDHPDPDGKHLRLIQQHASGAGQGAVYWIDYCCLPQSRNTIQEQELFRRTLPKITTIQSKGSTLVIPESNYGRRMWCYVEHFAGVLFSHRDYTGVASEIDYLGDSSIHREMLEAVQTLEEPPWDELEVTNPSDVPGIKYNYRFLSNLAKFQLHDRFNELRRTLPGHEIYSGYHYPQCAFLLDYNRSALNLRNLFVEFGGDIQYFYKERSLEWLAQRFSWSIFPDDYRVEDFRFSPALFYSDEMVGWTALLLGMISMLNVDNEKIVNLRELYAKIVLISLLR